jgi:hypothetical protein
MNVNPRGALGRRIVALQVQRDIAAWEDARAITAEGGTPGTAASTPEWLRRGQTGQNRASDRTGAL